MKNEKFICFQYCAKCKISQHISYINLEKFSRSFQQEIWSPRVCRALTSLFNHMKGDVQQLYINISTQFEGMTTEQLQETDLPERPETSKFSRVSRRHNRTKTQMRSTSNNWGDHQRNNPSPFVKRKLTLDKRKGPLSPKPIIRPTSQEKPFRAGITLQQYFIDHPVNQVENDKDPEGAQQTLFPQEFNFQIQERQDDDDQQSISKSRQMNRPSRKNLDVAEPPPQDDKNFSIRNVSNLWKHKEPPKIPGFPSNPQDRKRKTTFEFYKHKHPKTNLEEFQATEQYLLKKYANKFQLNDLGQQRRIDKVINRSQKQPLLGTRTKII